MCFVSVVTQVVGDRIPVGAWNQSSWDQYQTVVRETEKLDALLNQPDCHDPGKAEWMKAVEERLAKLEAAQ